MKGDICLRINKKVGLLLLAVFGMFSIADYVSLVDVEDAGGITIVQPGDTAPVGTIAMWGTSTPPIGWMELNGQSTADSPELSKMFGAFLPDFRGQFVRAWDHGAGIDPDSRAILTKQGDAIRNITGSVRSAMRSGTGGTASADGAFKPGPSGNVKPDHYNSASYNGFDFDASLQVPTAEENRPTNIAVMYIIKAY